MAEQSYPPATGTGEAGGHTMNIHYEVNGVETPLITGCQVSGCHGSSFTANAASPRQRFSRTCAMTSAAKLTAFFSIPSPTS